MCSGMSDEDDLGIYYDFEIEEMKRNKLVKDLEQQILILQQRLDGKESRNKEKKRMREFKTTYYTFLIPERDPLKKRCCSNIFANSGSVEDISDSI